MAKIIKKDWELIEREFRAGQLSNHEIARQFSISEGAIRRKAKLEGWVKDLAEKVRKEVRNKLVRVESRSTPEATDREVIDAAAERGVQVVIHHRGDIQKHRAIVQILVGQLDEVATKRDAISDTIRDETKEDNGPSRRNSMLKAISLPTHASVARDLATALKQLIPLERQAYNLDNGRGDSGITSVLSPDDVDKLDNSGVSD